MWTEVPRIGTFERAPVSQCLVLEQWISEEGKRFGVELGSRLELLNGGVLGLYLL
jgi:hypothetical protein